MPQEKAKPEFKMVPEDSKTEFSDNTLLGKLDCIYKYLFILQEDD